MNLAGLMSIPTCTAQISSISMCPPQERVSYGSERSASIFIRVSRGTNWRDCRFLAPDRNDYGIMTIVAQEAEDEEDGGRCLQD